ncbi:hypothetical protein ACP275_14G095700 [Erythranthe tilingii]
MGDLSDTETANTQRNLCIKKTASLKDLCKLHKSHIMKWNHHHHQTKPLDIKKPTSFIKKTFRGLSIKKRDESYNTCVTNSGDDIDNHQNEPKTPKNKKKSLSKHDGDHEEELHISSPKLLSRTTSWISPIPSPNLSTINPLPPVIISDFQENLSGGSAPSSPQTPRKQQTFLSKTASGRNMTTPIFFSQSAARRKPPPVERKLECTLEDLCFGCVKKIDITRDAISCSGLIVQEEDMLLIKVKPGWKNGTKIVFEGKGDERPGSLPADIIFAVDEKIHPLFERDEDDLEVGVEVPLVQALTGCTISVPLLGGEELEICIDEIIYPGYEKTILGQGMPKNKEDGLMVRGDLRLKFMVEFPEELTDCQRDEVVSILRDQCS